jgi:hypothetical protein
MGFSDSNLPRVLSTLMIPILKIFFVWMIIVVVYGLVVADDNDPDLVTFTFRCSSVLAKPTEYPGYIVEECTKLKRQQK